LSLSEACFWSLCRHIIIGSSNQGWVVCDQATADWPYFTVQDNEIIRQYASRQHLQLYWVSTIPFILEFCSQLFLSSNCVLKALNEDNDRSQSRNDVFPPTFRPNTYAWRGLHVTGFRESEGASGHAALPVGANPMACVGVVLVDKAGHCRRGR